MNKLNLIATRVIVIVLLAGSLLFPARLVGATDTDKRMPELGDLVNFGHYEQDNDLENGPETISWIVLAVEGDKALLISEMCLDHKPYNTELKSVTWETSTLRAFLNGDFMEAAFSTEEQKSILTTTLTNEDNPEFGTDGGPDTIDNVFLLSLSEAQLLFMDNGGTALPTPYALAQGASTFGGYSMWWLRSPYTPENVECMILVGSLSAICLVDDDQSVRPALWIDLDSGIF